MFPRRNLPRRMSIGFDDAAEDSEDGMRARAPDAGVPLQPASSPSIEHDAYLVRVGLMP